MKAPPLQSAAGRLKLIEPNVLRDSKFGVDWLNGEDGRSTLRLMGNNDEVLGKILPTTLAREADRVRDFIERQDQLNWMIEYDGNVIGTVWVNLNTTDSLPGPSIHIMIGDPLMREKGIGSSSIATVLSYLDEQGYVSIYSRHLTSNERAESLLKSLGFTELGEPYTSDTMEFQNLVRKR